MKLLEIADVRTGYTFRSKVDYLKPLRKGARLNKVCFAVQMRDIDDKGQMQPASMVPITAAPADLRNPLLLTSGDIVFKSRGSAPAVTLFDEAEAREGIRLADWNIDPGTITVFLLASPLYRLRARPGKVTPSYLFRYMKSRMFIEMLERNMEGSTLPTISVGFLKGVEIPVPSLSVQDDIVRLCELAEEEQRLAAEFIDKRKIYVEELIAGSIRAAVETLS